jgi:hypothetical protein
VSADRRLLVECQDKCSILVFEAWDVGKPEAEWFAEVFKRPGKPHWRWRLKTALGLLLGHEPVIDYLCFGPSEIVQLRDFLNECYPPTVEGDHD